MMKKTISMVLVLLLTLTLFGCGSAPVQSTPTEAPKQELPAQTVTPTPESEKSGQEEPQPEAPEADTEDIAHSKVLVVYFSATGTTKGVAERIASVTGGDLVEIIPAQPYTTEDLNYNDRTTRATVEQNTPDARPEIANEISLDGYDTVYLGYPIWWGKAPRILSTFVESHDFTGIAVIPFCTSGSSGAGSTGETLLEQAGSGNWQSATRFSGSVSDADLKVWIEEGLGGE